MARWLQGAPADARRPEASFTPDPLPDLLVFHARPMPAGALTADGLTRAWIDGAVRQLAATPAAVRAAALRHALGFEDRTSAAGGVAASRPRRVVVTAGLSTAVESALRAAGYALQPVAFTPFDADAASKVRHFETYNRTAAGQRVADIVAALRGSPGAALAASGDEALAAALATAIEPPRVAVLDVGGFDTSRDADFLDRLYIPGLRRAGDLGTASEMAQGRLVVHNAGATFAAPGARVQREALAPAEIVAILRRAFAGR
jgi:hypothetical protein